MKGGKKMSRFKKIAVFLMSCITTLSLCVIAYCSEGSTTVDINSQIGTAATSAANQASSVISTLLPIILGVIGTVVAVKLGIKLFRSFMGKA